MRILKPLVVAALLALPSVLPSQERTYWRIPSAISGSMLGAGAGWIADFARWTASGCTLCGPSLLMTPVGMGIGAGLGFVGGLRADESLSRGDSLTVARRRWLRAATFLAPPAIGTLGAFLIINPSEEATCCPYREAKKIADDEVVLLVGVGGGALLGYVLQDRTKGALMPRVGVSPRGDVGLSFSASW